MNQGLWRTPDAYAHLQSATGADLAWEFLRRNDAYRHEYAALKRDGAIGVDLTTRPGPIAQRGLVFRRRSRQIRR